MTCPSWGCPRAVSNRRIGEQLAGVGGRWGPWGKRWSEQQGKELKKSREVGMESAHTESRPMNSGGQNPWAAWKKRMKEQETEGKEGVGVPKETTSRLAQSWSI